MCNGLFGKLVSRTIGKIAQTFFFLYIKWKMIIRVYSNQNTQSHALSIVCEKSFSFWEIFYAPRKLMYTTTSNRNGIASTEHLCFAVEFSSYENAIFRLRDDTKKIKYGWVSVPLYIQIHIYTYIYIFIYRHRRGVNTSGKRFRTNLVLRFRKLLQILLCIYTYAMYEFNAILSQNNL